jgi:membrane protease YdiL (CAAX protease family)
MNQNVNSIIAIAISIILAVLVYKDAKRKGRSRDWAIGILALFPLFLPLYLLFRPRVRFLRCPECETENISYRQTCSNCEAILVKEGKEEMAKVSYANWSILDAAAIFLISIFPTIFIGSMFKFEHASKNMWLTLLLMDNLLAIASIYTIAEICRRPLEAIGLTRKSFIPNILLAIPFSVLLSFIGELSERLAISVASYIFSSDAIEYLVEKEHESFKSLLPSDPQEPIMILVVFATIILAPIAEEIFFRGVLYTALKRRFGIILGIIFSAVVFAVVHGSAIQIFPLFLIGLALALIYEKSGLLLPSIATHSLFNTISIVAAYR